MNPEVLLKKLISIPSYNDAKTNEAHIGDFIFSYLRTNTEFSVKKQRVANGRYNILATTQKPTHLFAAHMDTVQPKQGWTTNQFRMQSSGGRAAGLGAVDTKGGIASLLSQAKEISKIPGIAFLFYCDEEYDFLGMKKFLETKDIRPKIALVIEPTGLAVSNAHRGLIEVSFAIQGKTGHAAFGKGTVNAIDSMNSALRDLREYVSTFTTPELGVSRMNTAYIHGGLFLGNKKQFTLGREGNNVADYAEAVVDIRTSSKKLTSQGVQTFLKKRLAQSGATMVEWNARHDFGALLTKKRDLKKVEKAVSRVRKVAYVNPQEKGYSDGQLIQEQWGIPVFYMGPRGGNAHAANEWVDISSLSQLARIYRSLADTRW